MMPSADKVKKWRAMIALAENTRRLLSGDASKLGGGLSFGAQYMFRKLGRAMLSPISAQQYKPLKGGKTSPKGSMAPASPKRRKTEHWNQGGKWQDWQKDSQGGRKK